MKGGGTSFPGAGPEHPVPSPSPRRESKVKGVKRKPKQERHTTHPSVRSSQGQPLLSYAVGKTVLNQNSVNSIIYDTSRHISTSTTSTTLTDCLMLMTKITFGPKDLTFKLSE